MDAMEAYKLTQKSLKSTAIENHVEWVDSKIQAAIASGKFCVIHPFIGYDAPNEHIKEAVYEHYRNLGFTIERHLGDPRDPRDFGYDEIKWDKPRT